MQTVYQRHSPECAGKILKVKELVHVENVPASAVRTAAEQRQARKASRGYRVVKSKDQRGGEEVSMIVMRWCLRLTYGKLDIEERPR
jgi:hypothetical protein